MLIKIYEIFPLFFIVSCLKTSKLLCLSEKNELNTLGIKLRRGAREKEILFSEFITQDSEKVDLHEDSMNKNSVFLQKQAALHKLDY